MVLTRAQKSGKEPLVKIPKKTRKRKSEVQNVCAEAQNVFVDVQNVCDEVQNVCDEVQNLSLCSDPKGYVQ